MRFYVRTSHRTGMSFGCLGSVFVILAGLMVLSVPVYVLRWSFDHWYTVPIGVTLIVVAVLAALGSALHSKGD